MTTLFLTDEELVALTGRTRPSAQRRYLADHRYPFSLTADGRPRVLRAVVEERLGRKVQPAGDGFNLAAAKRAG